MRTFIVSIIILLIIITGIVISTNFIKNCSDSMCFKIEKIKDLSEKDNYKDAKKVYDDLKKEWESKEKLLRAIIEHVLVENIHIDLIELSLDIKYKKNQTIASECDKLLFKVKHLFEKEKLTLPNLF